jgi:hypothetical protein
MITRPYILLVSLKVHRVLMLNASVKEAIVILPVGNNLRCQPLETHTRRYDKQRWPTRRSDVCLNAIRQVRNISYLTKPIILDNMIDQAQTASTCFCSRYGRKTVLTSITFLAGLSGLIHSFSVNYWMFIAFEFIDACFAAGIYSSGFIYGRAHSFLCIRNSTTPEQIINTLLINHGLIMRHLKHHL